MEYCDDNDDDDEEEEVFLRGTPISECNEDDAASRVNANSFDWDDGADEVGCINFVLPTNADRFWDVDFRILDAADDTALDWSSNAEDFVSSSENFNVDFAVEKK